MISKIHTILQKKKIILGVTGGIAAYKAIDIMRDLQRGGADIHIIMTENATHFVQPLTFSILSGHPVMHKMFHSDNFIEIEHTLLADSADLFLIVPATANCIGKLANGIADDFLTTFYLAAKCPLIIAPAMNWKMYEHKAVQANLDILIKRGTQIIEPEEGELACHDSGRGRLAERELIVDKVIEFLTPKTLSGKKILISAGPTREAWDAFRFISNPSSGKMGYALAIEARNKGADVTLISGPVSISKISHIKTIYVETASEMEKACLKFFPETDAVIMAAAVSDFRPQKKVRGKVKKNNFVKQIELIENEDIIKKMSLKKKKQLLIGFAAETEKLIDYAKNKIKEKKLDLIIANRIDLKESGFSADDNQCFIISPKGIEKEIPLLPKNEVASSILQYLEKLFEMKK